MSERRAKYEVPNASIAARSAPLLSLAEVAALCGVTRQAVWYWVMHGKLEAQQINREWAVSPEAAEQARRRPRRRGVRQ